MQCCDTELTRLLTTITSGKCLRSEIEGQWRNIRKTMSWTSRDFRELEPLPKSKISRSRAADPFRLGELWPTPLTWNKTSIMGPTISEVSPASSLKITDQNAGHANHISFQTLLAFASNWKNWSDVRWSFSSWKFRKTSSVVSKLKTHHKISYIVRIKFDGIVTMSNISRTKSIAIMIINGLIRTWFH